LNIMTRSSSRHRSSSKSVADDGDNTNKKSCWPPNLSWPVWLLIGAATLALGMGIFIAVNKGAACPADAGIGLCVGVWCALALPCVLLIGGAIALFRQSSSSSSTDDDTSAADEAPVMSRHSRRRDEEQAVEE
jgi:hypothetical protein